MSFRLASSAIVVSCLLSALGACGDAPQPPPDTRDRSPSSAQQDEGDDGDGDDDGEQEAKPDGGRKSGPGADAASTGGGSKVDAGRNGDASSDARTESDGGTDASTASKDASDASEHDSGDPDAGEPGPVATLKPKCVEKDSQVIIIGDSYFNWISHSFPQDIIRETGQNWRMEAIGAWAMGSGGIGLIPDQFRMSIERDPDAHTILMTGGGNDVLVADAMYDPNGTCKTDAAPTTPGCQKIVDVALDAADKLLAEATEAGIRDVVYVFYPHVPNGTLIGGPNPNAILDYTLPKVKAFCDGVEDKSGGKTRCHFIDLVPVFEGHADWFFPGDIHENSTGSAQMAKTIWAKMKEECVGQKSGDCCES